MLSQIDLFTKPETETKKKVLIHGMVEKKTFIKYSFYYLIIHDDLSIERIKS